MVSVLMPAYNAERFVCAAITSVLTQSYSAWELVIVDDGSTDATPEAVQSFADVRIAVVRQDNQGEAAARNRALSEARGQFIAFLDADDIYLPSALEKMVDHLNNAPNVDVVYSDGYYCDEHTRPLMRLSDHRPGLYVGNILEPLVLSSSVIAAINCTMTRKSTIDRHGVRFDPTMVIGPDWDFWIHLARHACFAYLDVPTCMYRVHQMNITKRAGIRRRNDDLVRGRLKIMNSDWFSTLSLATRRQFFYNLLVELLGDEPDQQRFVLSMQPFRVLPPAVQAELLRLIASSYLSRRKETEFSVRCLKESLDLQPSDRKGRVLFALARSSPSSAAALLSFWSLGRRSFEGARTLHQRKPKPVPIALLPGLD